MRGRSSSDRVSASSAVSSPGGAFFSVGQREDVLSICFWGSPLLRQRLCAAGVAFSPWLRLVFPEDGLCESAEIRVIPAEALDTIPSGNTASGIPETIAYGPIDSMARALLCGCADYLADPWLPEELFLRCGRLRNVSCINFPGGGLRYTPFALYAGTSVLPLSEQEYRLLRVLARRANSPVPRRDLVRVLGYEPGGASSRLIDVHIASLRAKLRSCGLGPPFARRWNPIRAVRGIGYGLSTSL